MTQSDKQALFILGKARDDAFMLAVLIRNKKTPPWGIGFHAQQAVEKAIKAVLTARDISYPYKHDLNLLVNILKTNGISVPGVEQEIVKLTPFGTALRYDEPEGDAIALDGNRTCRTVTRVIAWAEKLIPPLKPTPPADGQIRETAAKYRIKRKKSTRHPR
ncbi:MAG: HEPN domain-containing protein [Planctomycetota bacterium]